MGTMPSALTPLLQLREVARAMDEARAAVDSVLRHPALRRSGGPLVAEVGLRAAVASAALEGHPYELADVRAGTVTDPVLQGALRVSAALPTLAQRWSAAPRQVLARLHLLAARDLVDEPSLGRPSASPQRLDLLCELIAGPAGEPALLRAAVVHGELLAIRPFAGPNGVLARAAARLTLMAEGFDPRGLIAPEVGHRDREPEYVGTANAFATGTPDGLRSWLRHCAAATEHAAGELRDLAGAVA
ncbi:MAG TPA: oxidoreductase [Micromonosporaceae bacterium]